MEDKTLTLIKAAVAAVPYIGGSIVSFIGDQVTNEKFHVLESMIESLTDRINKLESRIDPTVLQNEKTKVILERCYKSIVNNSETGDLNSAIAIMSNVLLKESDPEKIEYTELDHFSRCVAELSAGAMSVFVNVVNIARLRDQRKFGIRSVHLSFIDVHRQLSNMYGNFRGSDHAK